MTLANESTNYGGETAKLVCPRCGNNENNKDGKIKQGKESLFSVENANSAEESSVQRFNQVKKSILIVEYATSTMSRKT